MVIKLESMKKILLLVLSISLLYSCGEEKYEDTEVYKKIIYIVGGGNTVNRFYHKFQESPSEGFISLYCSGSLMSSEDISIEIEIDEELIQKFNFSEYGEDVSKYVVALPEGNYNIVSMNPVLKAGDPYVRMPIQVNSKGLSSDEHYVIPLKINKVTEGYEINQNMSSVLYSVSLANDYSGLYKMTGTMKKVGSDDELYVFKDKNLVPIEEFTCRIFIGTENEDKENIPIRTMLFTVNKDNSVTIHESNTVVDLGGSYYDSEKKIFGLNYSFEYEGEVYEVKEKLTLPDKN